jgi:hypothetical protein
VTRFLTQKRPLNPALAIAFGCLLAFCAREAAAEQWTTDVNFPLDRMLLLDDDTTLLLLSNDAQCLVLLDSIAMSRGETVPLNESNCRTDEPHRNRISDIAVDRDSRFAYLVGTEDEAGGFILRLNLASRDLAKLRFGDRFLSPSIAISGTGELLIGDLDSNIITVLDVHQFDALSIEPLYRLKLPGNIYLSSGPVTDIAISEDGQYALASHYAAKMISLIDLGTAETLDQIGDRRGKGDTLSPLVFTLLEPAAKGGETASYEYYQTPQEMVFVADSSNRVVLLASLDREFGSLDLQGVLGMDMITGAAGQLTSGDADISVLIAAHRTSPMIATYYPGSAVATIFNIAAGEKGSFFEKNRVVPLPDRPVDMVMSASGLRLLVLGADHQTISVIDLNDDSTGALWSIQGSNRVSEAQKRLSLLGYRVGVDGFDGPKTRHALLLFQLDSGLPAHGSLDDRTLELLRSLSGPMLESEASRSSPDVSTDN